VKPRVQSLRPEVLKRLAKYLAQECFRNTMFEDLHAGITPDSQIGDYTDVVVRSPNGEIPWPNLSRLNDEEMKALMMRPPKILSALRHDYDCLDRAPV
jgi:hypothetical protein